MQFVHHLGLPALLEEYRQHPPMVERSTAWLTARGNRREPLARAHFQDDHWLQHRCAAINLRRLLQLGLTRDHNGCVLA